MKKQIFTVLSTGLLLASLPVYALASDASGSYTAVSYDVSVPQEYMVPYAYSEEGYFENGLVTGFGSAVTFKGLNEELSPTVAPMRTHPSTAATEPLRMPRFSRVPNSPPVSLFSPSQKTGQK